MEELKIESMEELREDFKKKLNLLIDLVKEQKESIALHKELISSLNGRYDLLYFQYGIAVRLAIMNEKNTNEYIKYMLDTDNDSFTSETKLIVESLKEKIPVEVNLIFPETV